MTTITDPLREEHKGLFPHIESMRIAAEMVQEGTFPLAARKAVEEAVHFLVHDLIPHAHAEDRALYPVVQKMMGAPEATATMSRDHVEVGRLTAELQRTLAAVKNESLTREQALILRRVLYGLYALVKVHFAKEEEIYLPLLDSRLPEKDAAAMFAAMEHAAHEEKHKLGH